MSDVGFAAVALVAAVVSLAVNVWGFVRARQAATALALWEIKERAAVER